MENEGKIWSDLDVDFLKKFYPVYGSTYCSKELKRNKKAVIARANKLKIKAPSKQYKYSKENLEPLVANANSIKQVLLGLGLRAAGGNYKVLNLYIKEYKLDTSHFETAAQRIKKIGHQFIATNLEDILIENSSFSRASLKEKLYKEGLKTRECELCGQGEEWKGKKMSLILDHINGVYNDNRLENLRIVCPNCNATLDTHCGRNKNLKQAILKQSIKKGKEYAPRFNKRKAVRPNKDILLQEVEELGYSGTGRKYGVSDNAIRKWLKNH